MPTFTVKSVNRTRDWEGKKSGPMRSYHCTLVDEANREAEVEISQKVSTAAPEPGKSVEGEIEKNEYGLKLKKAYSGGGMPGGGRGRGNSPEDRASIESQVAAKCLTELVVHDKASDPERQALSRWLTGRVS